jgi:hypothetical protein
MSIACGPRCPLYLFSEKDAASIANAAMRQNKVRRFRLLTPFCRRAQAPAASGLPGCHIMAGTCFPDVSWVAFCLDLTTFPKIQFFKKQS